MHRPKDLRDSDPRNHDTIIFIHRGFPFYLKPMLAQARYSNPLARLVLLGDEYNSDLGGGFFEKNKIDHFFIEDYFQSAKEFGQIYQHEGKNPYQYELFCFQRWFVMLDFVKQQSSISRFVYLDTDVLLYKNVYDVFKVVKTSMTVCDRVGPQYTFFKSHKILESYCDFIMSSYKNAAGFEKLKRFVRDYNNDGMPHISDMTTIGVFASENKLDNLGDCNRTDFYFDENVSSSYCVQKGFYGKKLIKKNGKQHFQKANGQMIEAGGCHLQGPSKVLWPFYVDLSILRYLNVETIYRFLIFNIKTGLKKIF